MHNERTRIRKYVDNRGNRRRQRKFVAVDGEGVTLPRVDVVQIGELGKLSTRHEYRFLRAGKYTLEKDRDLKWWECLDFLAHLPRGPLYQSFFFDYDVTMILRGVGIDKVQEILKEGDSAGRDDAGGFISSGTYLKAPNGAEYQVTYIPRKEFKVKKVGQNSYVCISDAGTFFQCSFLKALDVWEVGSEEDIALVSEGKQDRGIVEQITDKERVYNGKECELLSELMDKFRGVCGELGIVPKKWQGPGYLANVLLRQHNVITGDQIHLPKSMLVPAYTALHFGRFEACKIGDISQTVWEYDINSAYPWAMTQLPCLEHGEWIESTCRPFTDDVLFLSSGTFKHKDNIPNGTLPVRRKDGTIYYPLHGKGAYWSPEIFAAERNSDVLWEGKYYWVYSKRCDCRPFDWMYGKYEERLALGKSLKGNNLKLALNSTYGKMAQTVGKALYFNPVWCGLITALTRSRLLDAGQGLDDVVMYATDAIYTLEHRPDLELSDRLGEWGAKVHQGMHIVQPGLYFSGEEGKVKTRGIPRTQFVKYKQEFLDAWKSIYLEGKSFDAAKVAIPIHMFMGLRLANHRGCLGYAGEWVDTYKMISYDWRRKRQLEEWEYGHADTVPLWGDLKTGSVPYTKAFRRVVESEALEADFTRLMDQPDWGEQLYE